MHNSQDGGCESTLCTAKGMNITFMIIINDIDKKRPQKYLLSLDKHFYALLRSYERAQVICNADALCERSWASRAWWHSEPLHWAFGQVMSCTRALSWRGKWAVKSRGKGLHLCLNSTRHGTGSEWLWWHPPEHFLKYFGMLGLNVPNSVMGNQLTFCLQLLTFSCDFPICISRYRGSLLYLSALFFSQTHHIQIQTSILLNSGFGLESLLLTFYVWKPFH